MMPRKDKSTTIHLTAEEHAELLQIAAQFDVTWGGEPNISGLIRAIAKRRLMVVRPNSPIDPNNRDQYISHLATVEAIVAELQEMVL